GRAARCRWSSSHTRSRKPFSWGTASSCCAAARRLSPRSSRRGCRARARATFSAVPDSTRCASTCGLGSCTKPSRQSESCRRCGRGVALARHHQGGSSMKVLHRGRAARLAAVLAAVLAVGVSATAATAAPKAHKLTTITLGVPGIPPVFLGGMPYTALEQGYYKKYGLDVQIKGFTSGTDAVRAVAAGQIDLAWSPTPFAMTLISKGTPLVGIEGMDKVDWVVGSNVAGIQTCAQLKGQNIGVDSI